MILAGPSVPQYHWEQQGRRGVLGYIYINLKPDRMKRMKLKKVLFLILLAAMIQIVCYSMRGFMISFSLSLAVSSLGIVPHIKLYMILYKNKVRF